MNRTSMQRLLISGAAAVVGLGMAQSSLGALIVDLRVMNGAAPSATPKSVTVSNGDVVHLGLYATVTGVNGLATDDGLSSLYGSVVSTLTGTGAAIGDMSAVTLAAPFNGDNSTGGTVQDLNSQAGLDVGGTTASNAAGFIFARSNAQVLGTSTNTGSTEFFLGTLDWTVSSTPSSGTTLLAFVNRATTTAAVWREDGASKAPANGAFTAGTPVNVSVPEPAAAALIGLAIPALLRRRKAR